MKADYYVRRGSLSGFPQVVSRAGSDPCQLLQSVGLPADALQSPDELMPVTTLVRLLNHTAQQPGLADIGLQLAQQQGPEILGVLGRLLVSSKTLRQYFYAVQRYMVLHNQAEHWRMQLHGDVLAIQRFEHCHTGLDARQYHELAMANCYRLTCLLGGEDIRPLRVEFAHSPLHPQRVYRQFFAAGVLFDQEQDQLLLERQLLERPLPARAAADISEEVVQRLLRDYPDNLPQQVATLVLQSMGTQQHSLQHIAGLMGLHPRALQRRLELEGVIFKQLVNDVRSRMACWYLTSSAMDITLLSVALGYSDVSAFSRAFCRWHGCSPRQWRQQHRRG